MPTKRRITKRRGLKITNNILEIYKRLSGRCIILNADGSGCITNEELAENLDLSSFITYPHMADLVEFFKSPTKENSLYV